MSDTQASTPENGSNPADDAVARAALDRAHAAALAANGGDLRRALEEAREVLSVSRPDLAASLAKALADLDDGALAELETLLEDVRRQLPND